MVETFCRKEKTLYLYQANKIINLCNTIRQSNFKRLLQKLDIKFNKGFVKAEYTNGLIDFECSINYLTTDFTLTFFGKVEKK